jgi:hypothetical protein
LKINVGFSNINVEFNGRFQAVSLPVWWAWAWAGQGQDKVLCLSVWLLLK